MASSTPRLLSLPQELIHTILTMICDTKTYQSLSRACRKLNTLTTPFVYESVIIRQPFTGEKFAEALTNAPLLNSLVHKLQIHLHGTEDDVPFNIPEDFTDMLANLVNLESLAIKSDYFDTEQENNIFCRLGALPALRSCHLGFDYINQENATWILHPYESIFFHPTLQSLTITGACAQTPWSNLAHAPAPHTTNLQSLRLLNCDLSARQISEMLSYPRALKHFTFKGQAPDPIITGYVRDANRSAYIDALRQHASSLESLDLDLYYHWTEPIDLTEFKALKKLTISRWMVTGDGNEHVSSARFLPAGLESLTFRDAGGEEGVVMSEHEECSCECWVYRHRVDDTYP